MKILFMGRKNHAAEMLRWTATQGHTITAVVDGGADSALTAAALSLNLPVISYAQAETLVSERPESVDLAVSYLFPKRIKEPIVSTPRIGCINFHPAILPDWKGCGGYNIAILNKLPEWGASAHIVDSDIDTGPIIRVFRFSFDYRLETACSLEKKTQKAQRELYKSVILEIAKNDGIKSPLIPNSGGVYISKKEMLDMMEIKPGDDISLKARAFWFPPYHGAYMEIDGVKYTLADDFILSRLAGNKCQDRRKD